MTLKERIKSKGYNLTHFARLLWPELSYGSQRNKMSKICAGEKPEPKELKELLKKLKI